jgi:Dolichyl-phosphate-mannose-protein mannosyltransferase
MIFNNNTGAKLSMVIRADRGSELYPKKLLLGILFAGMVCRVCISFLSGLNNIHTDSHDYFLQADALLNGGYTNFFPNGYPFIVAVVKYCAGNSAVPVLLWMNILMSVLIIYFSYDITKKIFGQENTALLAAFIVAFFPSQINYVRWLMTEVPTTFFMLGAYFFYYNKRWWWSGLFLGMATLVRTEILPVLVLLLLTDAVYRRKINFVLMAGGLLPLLLAASYCQYKTGEFSLAGHGRFNILASITASGDYVDWQYSEKHPEYDTKAKAVDLYISTFKTHPLDFIKNRLANLWELWGFYASATIVGRSVITRIIIGLGNFFLIAFGLPAWWKNRKDYNALIIILPFLVITIVHIVFFAMQRYTYPVEPFMIILAAWTIQRYFRKPAVNQHS